MGAIVVDCDGERWYEHDHTLTCPTVGDVELRVPAGGHVTLDLHDERRPAAPLEAREVVLVAGSRPMTSHEPTSSFRVRLRPGTYETFRVRVPGYTWCDLGPVTVPETHAIALDVVLTPVDSET